MTTTNTPEASLVDELKPKHLKPCPFCGTAVKYVTESDDKPPFGLRIWIRCPQCRQASVCSNWYGGDLGTTDACWNTRHEDTTPAVDDAGLVEQEYTEEEVRLISDFITAEAVATVETGDSFIASLPTARQPLEPWEVYQGVLTDKSLHFIRLDSTTDAEYEQAKLSWHEIGVQTARQEIEESKLRKIIDDIFDVRFPGRDTKRTKEILITYIRPYLRITPNAASVREGFEKATEKARIKWAWGLAESTNAALKAKAVADGETFVEAVKAIQLEAYQAGLAASGVGEWQPIETAPKDRTNIMVWWPQQFHCPLVAHWSTGKWSDFIGWKVSGWNHEKFQTEPTHWMPLPNPPLAKARSESGAE